VCAAALAPGAGVRCCLGPTSPRTCPAVTVADARMVACPPSVRRRLTTVPARCSWRWTATTPRSSAWRGGRERGGTQPLLAGAPRGLCAGLWALPRVRCSPSARPSAPRSSRDKTLLAWACMGQDVPREAVWQAQESVAGVQLRQRAGSTRSIFDRRTTGAWRSVGRNAKAHSSCCYSGRRAAWSVHSAATISPGRHHFRRDERDEQLS